MSSDDPNIELTESGGAPGVIDAGLLDRYVSGQASSADEEAVQALRAEHPAVDELVSAMRAVPAGGIPVRQQADVMLGWKRLLEQRQQAERGARRLSQAVQLREGVKAGFLQTGVFKTQTLRLREGFTAGFLRERIDTPPIRHTHRHWFKTAAVAVPLLIVIGWFLLTPMYQVSGIRKLERLVYTTGNGQRATIALPDGGTVALNVASRLEVPLDYMAGHRFVRLHGEGLFTVPHHQGAPFSVVAGTTVTRVLGTSFIVRRYGTDTVTTVAVREGKVAVGDRTLSAAQMVTAGRSGISLPARANDGLFTFGSGILTVNGVSLRQAIPDLDRWYDADIRFGDPRLASQPLEGEFAAGSLADLSSLLELTYDIRVVRDGRVLTLYSRQ